MNSPAPMREVAQRAFAREVNDATHTFRESDADRAPVYVLLPTGAKANRLFVVGTLLETNDVGSEEEYWQGRVVDPTGQIFVYAGQYQPEAAGMLRDTEPPVYVAVVGKPRTNWSYEDVYRRLHEAGLASVPGTAAEILVDEVRDVICPGKIRTDAWLEAMEAAAAVGLPMTATIMYGHVDNEKHRVMHLKRVRDLQDRTDTITEFVPLSFVHETTPLYERGIVDGGASPAEDELMIAVSRLFLDNIAHIQSSWVKYGDERGLKMLSCGADDFMGTILSEEITKRAGGGHGEFRSFDEYVEMIRSVGRVSVERSTDYEQRRVVDGDGPYGPMLGPQSDGTPLLRPGERDLPADVVSPSD